ncbi:triple gene block protein 3 [Birch carlavirus]|uniref:Movement protein TGBp3 n=1 Tax=Birch carlavirus TaxID=2248769 RepID=A0AAE5YI74_9VIRU|nr:triple gene block protein 3 [Birch carlavirus]QBJ27541.1 triple gene block protein 3 [Birch carlavirus]
MSLNGFWFNVILGFLGFVLVFFFLSLFGESRNVCVVTITGESIRISGCVFDSSFVEYASKLRIPNHFVGF